MNKPDDDFDLNDLFGTGLVDESEEEEDSALQRVAQRISGEYGEVIASWISRVLATSDPAETEGMQATVSNLLRLAQSAQRTEQVELLTQLRQTLHELQGTKPRTRRGDRARVALRDWIPAFAETLHGEDAERLLRVVRWDEDTMPLLDELKGVDGIGPRRLTRLYAAGLGNLDSVANADPEDVAAVTGIPVAIAEEVVRRARAFAVEERHRCVTEIQQRAQRLKTLLTRIHDGQDGDLIAAARSALAHVEGAFQELLAETGKPR